MKWRYLAIGLGILVVIIVVGFPKLYRISQVNELGVRIQSGQAEAVRIMVEANPKLLDSDLILSGPRRDRLKPLSLAAGLGQTVICSNLLALGANVNEVDKYKYTPLHKAIMAQETNVITLLVRNGADLTVKDFEGLTPMDWAKKVDTSGNLESLILAEANLKTNR